MTIKVMFIMLTLAIAGCSSSEKNDIDKNMEAYHPYDPGSYQQGETGMNFREEMTTFMKKAINDDTVYDDVKSVAKEAIEANADEDTLEEVCSDL